MFEEYVAAAEKEAKYKEKLQEPRFTMDYVSNVIANPEVLATELENVDLLEVNKLYDSISKGWRIILDNDFVASHKTIVANAFTNEKFVTLFSQVMSQVELNPFQRVMCNKLVYDYLTLNKEKDLHIQALLYNLGITINKDIIPGLMGIGLDSNTASNIAIARYSTQKETLAVKRVNVIIVNSPIEVMTEQMIVNIYEKLYDHLLPLFEGIMFDKWDEENFQDEEECEEIYGLINLALLDILNDMPDDMIYNILSQYTLDKQYTNLTTPVRFNIHSISSDYKRVIDAIDLYEKTSGNSVPSF